MAIDTKICGLNDRAGLEAALAGRARFVGLVFFPKSPRHVTFDQAASLAAHARGRAEVVAVTVNADDALLQEIAARLAPDWLQLHGDEPPARIEAVRRFAKRGIIKAIPIARSEDFAAASAYDSADWLLFDAKAPPNAALPGGNGAAFDWRLLQGRAIAKPWFLSGGLDGSNLATAIVESGARAVDVSSGVEAAPGLKDALKISRFLAAAHAA